MRVTSFAGALSGLPSPGMELVEPRFYSMYRIMYVTPEAYPAARTFQPNDVDDYELLSA